jgi:hypothetical protein
LTPVFAPVIIPPHLGIIDLEANWSRSVMHSKLSNSSPLSTSRRRTNSAPSLHNSSSQTLTSSKCIKGGNQRSSTIQPCLRKCNLRISTVGSCGHGYFGYVRPRIHIVNDPVPNVLSTLNQPLPVLVTWNEVRVHHPPQSNSKVPLRNVFAPPLKWIRQLDLFWMLL